VSATITDEQLAARELVRSWAAGSGASAAVRDVESGETQAWRPVYRGLADLGLFGVAVAEEAGGARRFGAGPVRDGRGGGAGAGSRPVATTALATLVVTDPAVLESLTTGRGAGAALTARPAPRDSGRISGTAEHVLGAECRRLAGAAGRRSRRAGRRLLGGCDGRAARGGRTSPGHWPGDLRFRSCRDAFGDAAAIRRSRRHGAGRRGRRGGPLDAGHRHRIPRRCASSSASRSAASRRSSTCALRCCCGPSKRPRRPPMPRCSVQCRRPRGSGIR